MAEKGYSPPGQPPQTPGLPQNPLPIVFDGFSGLNTKPSQQGIEDQEMYVCDGFMPLGKNNLRALRGLGAPIYTVPGGAQFAAGNIHFSGQPNPGDTLTLNGVTFTFAVSGGGYPTFVVNIGADLNHTLQNLAAQLTLFTGNSSLNVATYVESETHQYLLIFYNTPGPDGNTYTLATTGGIMTRSGTTLTGGGRGIKNFNFNNIGDMPVCMVCLDDGSLSQVNLDTLAVTVIGSGTATGDIVFTLNPSDGDTITLGGSVWTFKTVVVAPNQTPIGIDLLSTLAVLVDFVVPNLNLTPDPIISECSYTANATTLFITFKTVGVIGNAFTTTASAATPSGPHLTGGSDGAGVITGFPPDYSQWGSQYVIIVAPQTNGYFLWDGVNLFTAGTLAPQVDITNGGLNYTSAPTITPSGGHGSGATFSGSIVNGSLATITCTNPGAGYAQTDNIALTITGGGSDDMASAHAVIATTAGIASIIVLHGGGGYTALAKVTATSGGASVQASLAVVGQNGVITQVIVQNPGLGYTALPTLTISDVTGSIGSGASLQAVLAGGQIASITVDGGGTNYTTPPTITIVGDGTGAQLSANLTAGAVSSIDVVSGGINYTEAVLQFSGGNNGASALATIMPWGVSGTTVETYASRVWVGNGRVAQYSSPGNPADFDAGNGAGAYPSTDSFLRIAFTQFIQSNGFLYTFADSSINYISGVNTAGNPPITTFNNLNVDPQVGTPWHGTVQPFGRDLVFANPVGVFVSYGGAVTKVSDALDGIFASVPQTSWPGGFSPSAAVMTIFGIRCYILTLPVIDQVSGEIVIKCLMWDGKRWWTSPQEGLVSPLIASQDFNSTLTAYCSSDQVTINPMFTDLAEDFTRYLYSKLWDTPGVFVTKVQREIFGLLNINYLDPPGFASGTIHFAANPSPGDTITLNGVVWTFVASGAVGNQTNIGGNLAGTLAVLTGFVPVNLNTSTDPGLTVASYAPDAGFTNLVVTYKTQGPDGNAFTLVASAGLPSGPHLTGGNDGPSFFVAVLSENGVGTEVEVIPTKTGPFVFGPLRYADPGKIIGVRFRTDMADIQINSISLITQLQQSNV